MMQHPFNQSNRQVCNDWEMYQAQETRQYWQNYRRNKLARVLPRQLWGLIDPHDIGIFAGSLPAEELCDAVPPGARTGSGNGSTDALFQEMKGPTYDTITDSSGRSSTQA